MTEEDPEVVKSKNIFATKIGESESEKSFKNFCVKAGSLRQLVRRAAWLKRFPWIRGFDVNYSAPLTVQELEMAELAIVRRIQSIEFEEEIEAYEKQRIFTKKSRLYKLAPYIDENSIVRVGSHLGKLSSFHTSSLSPAILPQKGHFVELVIFDTHVENYHVGVEHTLALIRRKYWIVGAKVAVKKVLAKCHVCRLQYSQPSRQQMASLPKERLEANQAPFWNSAINAMGPLVVRRG